MRFSVVIPAHNEERLLPRALDAIAEAASRVEHVETIVVANRCTDATATIAAERDALVIRNEVRNIAAVRNHGATVATGEVLCTIDADSVMAPRTFIEVERLLRDGRFVGGGTKVVPERTSLGIKATLAVVNTMTFVASVSGAMFWCRRDDFDAISGFDETLLIGEDVDFARRLRAHGRRTGRRFTTQRAAPVLVSTRKFDQFGDWHMFAMTLQLRQIYRSHKRTDTTWVDRYFFDFNE